jgi:hypothetical protein
MGQEAPNFREMARMPFKKLRYARAALLATTMALAAPAAASAADCAAPPGQLTKAFAALNDLNDYFLAPGGDFEPGTASWKLSEDVAYVPGGVDLFDGVRALDIGTGDRATSPRFCVDSTYTHLRFHLLSPSGTGSMRVEAVVGRDNVTELATVSGQQYQSWEVTPFIPLALPLGLTAGERFDDVKLRFTATGDMQLDVVAVDPYRK